MDRSGIVSFDMYWISWSDDQLYAAFCSECHKMHFDLLPGDLIQCSSCLGVGKVRASEVFWANSPLGAVDKLMESRNG